MTKTWQKLLVAGIGSLLVSIIFALLITAIIFVPWWNGAASSWGLGVWVFAIILTIVLFAIVFALLSMVLFGYYFFTKKTETIDKTGAPYKQATSIKDGSG